MGSKPKVVQVPVPVAMPAAMPPAVMPPAALPPAVMPPAAPQDSPTAARGSAAQAGNATVGARAIGAAQGMNNTNLTGPRGIRTLDDPTQPRTLLGL